MTRLSEIQAAAERMLDPQACECRDCLAGVQRRNDRAMVATFVRDLLAHPNSGSAEVEQRLGRQSRILLSLSGEDHSIHPVMAVQIAVDLLRASEEAEAGSEP